MQRGVFSKSKESADSEVLGKRATAGLVSRSLGLKSLEDYYEEVSNSNSKRSVRDSLDHLQEARLSQSARAVGTNSSLNERKSQKFISTADKPLARNEPQPPAEAQDPPTQPNSPASLFEAEKLIQFELMRVQEAIQEASPEAWAQKFEESPAQKPPQRDAQAAEGSVSSHKRSSGSKQAVSEKLQERLPASSSQGGFATAPQPPVAARKAAKLSSSLLVQEDRGRSREMGFGAARTNLTCAENSKSRAQSFSMEDMTEQNSMLGPGATILGEIACANSQIREAVNYGVEFPVRQIEPGESDSVAKKSNQSSRAQTAKPISPHSMELKLSKASNRPAHQVIRIESSPSPDLEVVALSPQPDRPVSGNQPSDPAEPALGRSQSKEIDISDSSSVEMNPASAAKPQTGAPPETQTVEAAEPEESKFSIEMLKKLTDETTKLREEVEDLFRLSPEANKSSEPDPEPLDDHIPVEAEEPARVPPEELARTFEADYFTSLGLKFPIDLKRTYSPAKNEDPDELAVAKPPNFSDPETLLFGCILAVESKLSGKKVDPLLLPAPYTKKEVRSPDQALSPENQQASLPVRFVTQEEELPECLPVPILAHGPSPERIFDEGQSVQVDSPKKNRRTGIEEDSGAAKAPQIAIHISDSSSETLGAAAPIQIDQENTSSFDQQDYRQLFKTVYSSQTSSQVCNPAALHQRSESPPTESQPNDRSPETKNHFPFFSSNSETDKARHSNSSLEASSKPLESEYEAIKNIISEIKAGVPIILNERNDQAANPRHEASDSVRQIENPEIARPARNTVTLESESVYVEDEVVNQYVLTHTPSKSTSDKHFPSGSLHGLHFKTPGLAEELMKPIFLNTPSRSDQRSEAALRRPLTDQLVFSFSLQSKPPKKPVASRVIAKSGKVADLRSAVVHCSTQTTESADAPQKSFLHTPKFQRGPNSQFGLSADPAFRAKMNEMMSLRFLKDMYAAEMHSEEFTRRQREERRLRKGIEADKKMVRICLLELLGLENRRRDGRAAGEFVS